MARKHDETSARTFRGGYQVESRRRHYPGDRRPSATGPSFPSTSSVPPGRACSMRTLEDVDEGTDMFEWLQREISAIKTPRFHTVDGPADARLREAVLHSDLPLRTAYRQFVIQFGLDISALGRRALYTRTAIKNLNRLPNLKSMPSLILDQRTASSISSSDTSGPEASVFERVLEPQHRI